MTEFTIAVLPLITISADKENEYFGDRIIGDAEIARNVAIDYPDIRIEILESGYLIAVECAEEVNISVAEFLEI